MVIGGTASTLAGGKFANGAVTAAFGFAFNSTIHKANGRPKIPLSTNNPEGGFATYSEASIAQQKEYDKEYMSTNDREGLLGWIGEEASPGGVRYYYSEMIVVPSTFKLTFDKVSPVGIKLSGISHAHPAISGQNQEGFSIGDRNIVGPKRNRTGLSINVRTPAGNLRILDASNENGKAFQYGDVICRACLALHPDYR